MQNSIKRRYVSLLLCLMVLKTLTSHHFKISVGQHDIAAVAVVIKTSTLKCEPMRLNGIILADGNKRLMVGSNGGGYIIILHVNKRQ